MSACPFKNLSICPLNKFGTFVKFESQILSNTVLAYILNVQDTFVTLKFALLKYTFFSLKFLVQKLICLITLRKIFLINIIFKATGTL